MNFVCYNFGKSETNENRNYSSCINLPQSYLSYMMSDYGSEDLDFPLTFEVRNFKTLSFCYCTVYEFHAEENVCYMPLWMMSKLGCNDGDSLYIRLSRQIFSRGTRIAIRPQCQSFFDLPDLKEALEHSLINYTILTKGDLISLSILNRDCVYKEYLIEITQTHPDESINIIDCDLEIDFDLQGQINTQSSDTNYLGAEHQGHNIDQDSNIRNNSQLYGKSSVNLPETVRREKIGSSPQGAPQKEDSNSKSKFVAFSGQGYTLGRS